MAALSVILSWLQVLTKLVFINTLQFDAERRAFRRKRAIFVLMVQYLLILPSLLVALAASGFVIALMLLTISGENMQGSKSMSEMYALFVMLLTTLRICSSIYIVGLYNFRLSQVQHLLNSFVRIYDQYEQLFGSPVRFKWGKLIAVCIKILYYNFVFFLNGLTSVVHFSAAFMYNVFSLLPMVLTWLALFGVTLLHAVYCGVQQAMQDREWRQSLTAAQIEQLLRFFDELMHLRLKLEARVQPFLSLELALEAFSFVIALHVHLIYGSSFRAIGTYLVMLLYPMSLTCWSDDICHVQQSLGNDLLTFVDGEELASAAQQAQLFCLYRGIVDKKESSSLSVLHLRRGFILAFLDFAWTKSMMLNAVFVTTAEYRYIK